MTASLQLAVAEAVPGRVDAVEAMMRTAAQDAYDAGSPSAVLYTAMADELTDPHPGIRARLMAAVAMADEQVDVVVGEIVDTACDHGEDQVLLALGYELAAGAHLSRAMAGRFRDQLGDDTPPANWT